LSFGRFLREFFRKDANNRKRREREKNALLTGPKKRKGGRSGILRGKKGNKKKETIIERKCIERTHLLEISNEASTGSAGRRKRGKRT